MGSAVAGVVAAAASRSVAASVIDLGESSLTTLSDGYYHMPSDFFLGIPSSLRNRLGNLVELAANTYAYSNGERTFLFDAGAGINEFIKQRVPTASKLPGDLRAAGIARWDVTDIIITHMHPDHVGGLIVNGRLAFPNAAIHIAADEWNFWNAKGFDTGAPQSMRSMVAMVQKISRAAESNVVLHSGSADLGSGVQVMPAPGHTPGHTAIILEGGREQLIVVGDLTVHEDVHFANPNYGWALDIDGKQAVKSRKSLLDMIATDGLIMGAAHVTKPGLGRAERDGDGYRFVALQPSPRVAGHTWFTAEAA